MACSLWLELTPHCNLDCSFCYNPWRGSRAPGRLSAQVPNWCSVVELLAGAERFEYVALSGGEPLLYRELAELVRRLRALDQVPIVTTNGRLATERKLRGLANAGLAALQVPLLAVTPELHDRLSGRPSWHRAVRAILVARAIGLRVGLTFVATSENVREFPRVADLADTLGIGDLVFSEVHLEGQGAGKESLRPPVSASLAAIEAVECMELRTRIHVRPSTEALRAATTPALPKRAAPWHRVAVDPSGQLKLCNQSVTSLGNVSDFDAGAVAELLERLRTGDVAAFRDRVSNCACLDARELHSGSPIAVRHADLRQHADLATPFG